MNEGDRTPDAAAAGAALYSDRVLRIYVLHCLPGSMPQKAAAFDHLGQLLNPGGVIFGTTLLSIGVERGWAACRLIRYYNANRIFSNTEDSLDDLQTALASRFSKTTVTTAGCAAFFHAIK